jgi:peptide-methionine (S)-S-oxide reductase
MMKYETAVFGGGCFWCLDSIFSLIKGVESVESGYAGGLKENPAYEEVCSGNTGHAEVVKIKFNPEIVTYRQLLEVFFYIHDPTTPNRQGDDIGEQYRSVILFNSPVQKKTAEEFISDLIKKRAFPKSIVTEITPLDKFFKAEDYHQKYFDNNYSRSYCQIVISPKLKKFKERFSGLLK